MPAFSIRSAPGVLHLAGEVDLDASPDVLAAGRGLLDAGSLVVDMAAVTFFDSSAMSVLIELRNVAMSAGQTVALANVPARVHRILDITGLSAVFEIRTVSASEPTSGQAPA